MSDKEVRRVAGRDYPRVNTFTAASARRLSDYSLTFAEMYPHEAAEYFDSDIEHGLEKRQVRQKRAKYGDNAAVGLPLGFRASLKRQLKNLPNVLLAFSLILFYAFRPEPVLLITAAALIAAAPVCAFFEHRASLTFSKLRHLSSPRVTVVREGRQFVTDSRSLVPGDIIILETDNIVPADARLIETASFMVLEAPAGGKQHSVRKDARFVADSKEDRLYENMVYAGSVVTSGKASAVVCATGRDTRTGKRAAEDPASALPKYLRNAAFALRLVSVCSVLGALILLLTGILTGESVSDSFLISLTVACTASCETAYSLLVYGESAALADALSKGAVFRSADPVPRVAECETVMCCKDMAFPPAAIILKDVFVCFETLEYNRWSRSNVTDIIRCMILCSSLKEKLRSPEQSRRKRRNAESIPVYEGGEYTLAVVEAAIKAGYTVEDAKKDFYRIEAEFDSSGEACRVLGLLEGKNCVILRGSPESVLARCAGYRREGRNYRLDKRSAERILGSASQMAKTQIPVAIAMGYTNAESLTEIDVESKLIFLGFAGFYSETTLDTASAVYRLSNAGVNIAVNTDDQYYAAFNHAENAGIITDESEICTPDILHDTDEGIFAMDNENYRVFDRLTDEEWTYILRLRNSSGHKVFAQINGMGQAGIAGEARASFAITGRIKDALLEKCDVRFAKGGLGNAEIAISRAKLAVKRIASVCQYMSAAYYVLFFWCFISLVAGDGMPFGVRELLVYGLVLAPSLCLPLAFSPVDSKTLYDRESSVSPRRISDLLVTTVLYSAPSGAICYVAANLLSGGGEAGRCAAFAAFSATLWLYSVSCGSRVSAISGRFYRNYYFWPSLVVTAAFALVPAFVPAVRALMGFSLPSPSALGASAALPFVLWLAYQAWLMFREVTRERKRRGRRSAG